MQPIIPQFRQFVIDFWHNNLETIIDMNQYIIEGFFKDEKGCLKISALALFHLTLSFLIQQVCAF